MPENEMDSCCQRPKAHVKRVMMIIMHCQYVTSGAQSNEIAYWFKMLTRDDSETMGAACLTSPPQLNRINELKQLTY